MVRDPQGPPIAADGNAVVPGLLITSVVTAVMSAALFTRRAKSGWLDELAGIRGGALSEDGELDQAFTDEPDDHAIGDGGGRDDQSDGAGGTGPGAEAPAAAWPEPATEAPHPVRPHEVWHAHDGLAGAPRPVPGVEERVAGEELQDDGEPTGDSSRRFRFARLRPVGDELHHGAADSSGAAPAEQSDDAPEAPATVAGPGELFFHDHTTADPAVADPDPAAAPFVPLTVERSTNGLIDGPVRRGRRRARRTTLEPPTDPWRVLGLAAPQPGDVDLAPADSEPAGGERAGSGSVIDPDAVAVPDVTAAPVVAEPEPVPPPAVVELVPGADGTLEVAGTVRLDPAGRAAAIRRSDGSISVDVAGGWCWTVAAEPVSITTPGGELSVPAATTALSVVEADGTTFLVVIGGEAVLAHSGGRLRLRAGAMVLRPVDGEPQVDVATEDEIAGDPLVSRNRALDAAS